MYKHFFKRFFDIILSFCAITFFIPFYIIMTPIIAIKMKGNPFFIQRRPGKNCKIFSMLKYRSMTNEKDSNGLLLSDEKRLTKFGMFLRKTSIDELPELFNIFVGQMSIVGPRPQLIKDMIFFDEEVMHRQDVRPGLTGLAQANGRNKMTWKQKFEYDNTYIKNLSLINDIKIILLTVVKVLKRDGITEDDVATATDYGDWLLDTKQISKEYYDDKIKTLSNFK